jgi:hypothetical protein
MTNLLFDEAEYLEENPDVLAAGRGKYRLRAKSPNSCFMPPIRAHSATGSKHIKIESS